MNRMVVLKTFASPVELRTERTLLRQWKDSDLPAWIQMNADPTVRRFFPSILDAEQAAGEAGRIRAAIAQRGWGPWVLEIPGELPFAGFVGLMVPNFEAPFMPAVEIGWRLAPVAWGQGYATEAAAASLKFAFTCLELPEIVSLTVPDNLPSQAVMRRIGLSHNPADDFDHPRVADGHPFKRHVLYRIDRSTYLQRAQA